MGQAKGFVRIVGAAEDEYMPSGPPMSPLTVSCFTIWALFDVRFGSSRETMGSCILRVAPEFVCPSWLIDAVQRMQRSRMGFYVHCVARRIASAPIGAEAIDREGSGPAPDGSRQPATGDAVNAASTRFGAQSFEINWYLFDAQQLQVSCACLGQCL